jgi:predicted alpha/beta hydrolase family esterase
VIASSTEPYVYIDRTRLFARCWSARLVEVGDQGHINVDSGHGEWSAGERYLAELLEEV